MINSKECKYGCGETVYWDDTIQGRVKWRETGSGIEHGYKRCSELLKLRGKEPIKHKHKKEPFVEDPYKRVHPPKKGKW